MLEPPQCAGSNKYPQSLSTPVNPSFTIKVGFKEVKIIKACFRDGLEGQQNSKIK